MTWFRVVLAELFALFADDVRFTIAIILWVGFATMGLPRLPVDPGWLAPLLFLGCAVILVANAWRTRRPE